MEPQNAPSRQEETMWSCSLGQQRSIIKMIEDNKVGGPPFPQDVLEGESRRKRPLPGRTPQTRKRTRPWRGWCRRSGGTPGGGEG